MEAIQRFLEEWTEDPLGTKAIFADFLKLLTELEAATLEFHQRPGVSHSLRGVGAEGSQRPLFVMIDVIDDDPSQRWLSVCFYGDSIEDPEERGDLIPGGLLGADGYCFDMEEADTALTAYVRDRIREAHAAQTPAAG
jgi:hypothetical protein